MIKLHRAKSEVALLGMRTNSVDSIVTDPPYELGFMGKSWDNTGIAYSVDLWKECLRVLKPGGYLLSFGGTRTYHRMACAIEDAGFEIRDQIQWLYGSGFPKSMNVGKAIDKLQGNERKIIGENQQILQKQAKDLREGKRKVLDSLDNGAPERNNGFKTVSAEITKGNSEYEGWGTALKPANEPICMARKPLSEKTVAQNVLKWGTGGINIDGCRVEYQGDKDLKSATFGRGTDITGGNLVGATEGNGKTNVEGNPQGRFPANVIHDGSEEVLDSFPNAGGQQGDLVGHNKVIKSPNGIYGTQPPRYDAYKRVEENKSASRFFYCAKTSKKERNLGCDDIESKQMDLSRKEGNVGGDNPRNRGVAKSKNNHPTVKPLSLMRYLCRLVTPPKGMILDPFFGSGTTGCAAKIEGFSCIGIDDEQEHLDIAEARIKAWEEEKLNTE